MGSAGSPLLEDSLLTNGDGLVALLNLYTALRICQDAIAEVKKTGCFPKALVRALSLFFYLSLLPQKGGEFHLRVGLSRALLDEACLSAR